MRTQAGYSFSGPPCVADSPHPYLGESALGTISLDTNKAHLVRQHRDITAVFTWVNDERAMVLLPSFRKNAPWYVVMESAAYKYDNPRYLARQSAIAAEVLGMDESTTTWGRIASIIHDGLPDLIRMPSAPDPEFHLASIGHMVLRADGEVIGGQDIRLEKTGLEFAQ